MTIKELEKVISGERCYRIDTNCDYIIIEYPDIVAGDFGFYDSIVTDIYTDDDGKIIIECEMVRTDDDGQKINCVTGEKV